MKLAIKLVSIIVLIMGLLLALALPVFAIADPDVTFQINAVQVYRNCLETSDQLYIVDYTIDYTANPDENITEAFLARLMKSTTELGAAAPYAYYDEGYDRGIVAIYFSAADAPTWEDSGSAITLVGNPMLEWSGDPPETTVSSFDLWDDSPVGSGYLAGYILAMADILELAWSVDMIETTAAGSKLTTLGEAYFTNAIENLRVMAPTAFSGQITQPEVEKREFTEDYADQLAASVTGTPLDLTPLGDAFGVSRAMVTAILYYGVVIVFLALVTRKIGSYKPLMLLLIPCTIGGAFLGVPLVITIMAGFIALVLIAYVLFYKPATA